METTILTPMSSFADFFLHLSMKLKKLILLFLQISFLSIELNKLIIATVADFFLVDEIKSN